MSGHDLTRNTGPIWVALYWSRGKLWACHREFRADRYQIIGHSHSVLPKVTGLHAQTSTCGPLDTEKLCASYGVEFADDWMPGVGRVDEEGVPLPGDWMPAEPADGDSIAIEYCATNETQRLDVYEDHVIVTHTMDGTQIRDLVDIAALEAAIAQWRLEHGGAE